MTFRALLVAALGAIGCAPVPSLVPGESEGGVVIWLDRGSDPDTRFIRVRNESEQEVRILSVEITGNASITEDVGRIVPPGREDSIRVDSSDSLSDPRFDLKVHWEKIFRTKVQRTIWVEVPPGTPDSTELPIVPPPKPR